MNTLTNEIQGIKTILTQLTQEVEKLISSEDNLESDRIKFLTNLAIKKRNELLKKYPLHELQKYNDELSVLVKNANSKLETLRKLREKASAELRLKMKTMQNKKKILAYGK